MPTLEQDWERLKASFIKCRELSVYPSMFIYANITELRKTDNKGIDFAIRRLWASDVYREKFRLYGGPLPPRYPLRIKGHRVFYPSDFETHYIFISIPEFRGSGVKTG